MTCLQKSFCIFILLLLTYQQISAQTTRRVLFLGNSYTSANNLPQLVENAAQSTGDILFYDSYTPGGYTLQDHNQDANGINKIKNQTWDYIILQGQSQEPITNTSNFNGGGEALKNKVNQHNPCAVTMLYVTWGRKNGDQSNCTKFPVMCTYQGMDTTLRNTYLDLAAKVNGEVSPVSVVWQYLRNNHPGINLYQSDGSHPSLAGSYAAACCFYTTIFKKDPSLITYNPGLSSTEASTIKNAVKSEVYNKLNAWNFKQAPTSDFSYEIGAGMNEVLLHHKYTPAAEQHSWTFGDGGTSSLPHPSHSYNSDGTYKITLTTSSCNLQGLHTSTSDTTIQFCAHTPTVFTNNAWVCHIDTLLTQPADAYQWVIDGKLVPETSQQLNNYKKYPGSSYTVLATVKGCTELSRRFSNTPDFSGYYFDMKQNSDPCEGDTVWFAALHINGTLPGTEQIYWYRNDTLLSSITNEDSMFATTAGRYLCKIVAPTSKCPLDTTYSSEIEFDCTTGIIEKEAEKTYWSIYPNPANDELFIILPDNNPTELMIYNYHGQAIKARHTQNGNNITLHTAALPDGLYILKVISKKENYIKSFLVSH